MSLDTNDKTQILHESEVSIANSTDESIGIHLTGSSTLTTALHHEDVPKVVKTFSVIKQPYENNEDGVNYVASFDSGFRDILGISPISPTKAWVHNIDEAKLVDLEKERVLRDFTNKYMKAIFYRIKGVDEMGIMLLDPTVNILSSLRVKNPLHSIVDFNPVTQSQVCVFIVLKSDEIVTCVKKTHGCACCQKIIPYIQLYSKDGKFLRQNKLQHEGKQLIRYANEMVENNNGDIIIGGYKHAYFDVIVVLDSTFKFRFTYEGTPSTTMSIDSLAVDQMNNIYFVNQQQFIEVISENGNFLRRVSVACFHVDGLPNKIAIDSYDQIWIVTTVDTIVCLQLNKLTEI